MKHSNVQGTLIAKTIEVMATEGLDKTTTKAIVSGTGINEGYIYRHFANKDDLLVKTFDALDEELVSRAMENISIMNMPQTEYETRCWLYFSAMWRFLLGNRAKCRAFIQYYYSPYFGKYSATGHKARYQPFIAKFQTAFRSEANVWMLFNHLLTTMLDFALKVMDGAVPDDDDTAAHVFQLVYHSAKLYFR
ncbi:MAG: TetR/AcrR family transcriptional regulator [Clostridia bacterium]|nr:TetR/AcrR family transcriptional regulator [Clostridia bacterium]